MELVRAPLAWHKDPHRIADLGRWLVEQGRGPDDWPYFIERASKWGPEYEEMCREEEQDRFVDERDAFEGDVARRSAL